MTALTYGVFGLYCCIAFAGAGAAVFSKSLVRAMFGLIASLLGVAGLYLLMQSPFLAFMQLLIYVGAVSVLIFFALMLTNAQIGGEESEPAPKSKGIGALLAGLIPLVLLVPTLVLHPVSSSAKPKDIFFGDIGRVLLEEYVLPFELISAILFVAMAGGVFLAWDRRKH